MYTAMDLSKYVIQKCIDDNQPISNLQLQKILYYIQKDFLRRGDIAFQDEFEAWQFGPVVPDVYYRYCGNGAMPITFEFGNSSVDSFDAFYIDRIVEMKRMLAPWDLVRETHKADGAWAKTYQDGKGSHHVIPITLIKEEAKRGLS